MANIGAVASSDMDYFWARVADASDPNACWTWTGPLTSSKYGWIRRLAHPRPVAHRFAYEQLVGPIPDGMQLDHQCHNRDKSCPGGRACLHRRCVNPAHLEPTTCAVNIRRGRDRIDTCPAGHPWDEENTSWRRGARNCRACHVAEVTERRARLAPFCACGQKLSTKASTQCRPCYYRTRKAS